MSFLDKKKDAEVHRELFSLQKRGIVEWYKTERGYHSDDTFASPALLPAMHPDTASPLLRPLDKKEYPLDSDSVLLLLNNQKCVPAHQFESIGETLHFYFDERVFPNKHTLFDFELTLEALDRFEDIYDLRLDPECNDDEAFYGRLRKKRYVSPLFFIEHTSERQEKRNLAGTPGFFAQTEQTLHVTNLDEAIERHRAICKEQVSECLDQLDTMQKLKDAMQETISAIRHAQTPERRIDTAQEEGRHAAP